VKVLIVGQDTIGEGLAFALKCKSSGHAVRLSLGPRDRKTTGEGFKGVQIVDNWLASVKWADIVIPMSNDLYRPKMDSLRKMGIKVFGPSEQSSDLEITRAKGMKFLEQNGISVPKYQQFNSLSEAEAHVMKTEERFVFKTMGNAADKSLSFVSKSPADMVARLQLWQKMKLDPKGPVILQEFIDGVEFAVSCWMGSEGFIGKPNENFEHKKPYSGNLGPNCGESGTVCKYVDDSKLADEVLYPLESSLLALEHLGDIDVNCIVDKKGRVWPLEFTCRMGWPYFNIMNVVHKGDPVQWMLDACNGKDTLEVSPQIACGIILAQPDFPFFKDPPYKNEGIPIYGVTDKNMRYIQPHQVKITKQPVMDGKKVVFKDTWTTVGAYVAVVTGLGKTVRQAKHRAYATLKELDVSNGFWRDDIGEGLKEQIPELHKHGFATEFKYEVGEK
jgi:phosphoribosylamine--glycine ligase